MRKPAHVSDFAVHKFFARRLPISAFERLRCNSFPINRDNGRVSWIVGDKQLNVAKRGAWDESA